MIDLTKLFLMLILIIGVSFCIYLIITELYNVSVDLNIDESERFSIELFDYFVSENGFAIEKNILDSNRLDYYDKTGIEPFYHCNYIYHITVDDITADNSWEIGSFIGTEIDERIIKPTVIMVGNQEHQGKITLEVSDNIFSYTSCMILSCLDENIVNYEIPWHKNMDTYVDVGKKTKTLEIFEKDGYVCVNSTRNFRTSEMQNNGIFDEDYVRSSYFCRNISVSIKDFYYQYGDKFNYLEATNKGNIEIKAI